MRRARTGSVGSNRAPRWARGSGPRPGAGPPGPGGPRPGQEGWYVHSFDVERDAPRSYRLDRIKSATVLDERFEPRPGIEPDVRGWPRTGEVETSRAARVWISPERARWAREDRRVVEELADGSVIVVLHYAGETWLSREILKYAGDAVVLEPEDARRVVLEAAEALEGAAAAGR